MALTIIWQSQTAQFSITSTVETLQMNTMFQCWKKQGWWTTGSRFDLVSCVDDHWTSSRDHDDYDDDPDDPDNYYGDLVSCVDDHPPRLLPPTNPVSTDHHLLRTPIFETQRFFLSFSLSCLHEGIQAALWIVNIPRNWCCSHL